MNIFKLFILLIGTAPYSQYTLSTVGSPCPWNHTDFSCAICTAGIYLLIYFIFDYFNSSNFFFKDAHVCAPHAEPPKARFKNTEQYCRKYTQSWNYRCWGTSKYHSYLIHYINRHSW